MPTFNQRLQPATEAHVNAQLAFLNDMTQSLLQSVQQIGELHLNLTQRFIEETSRPANACAPTRAAWRASRPRRRRS